MAMYFGAPFLATILGGCYTSCFGKVYNLKQANLPVSMCENHCSAYTVVIN